MILQIADLLVKKLPHLSSSEQIQCFAPPAVQESELFVTTQIIHKPINYLTSDGGSASSLLKIKCAHSLPHNSFFKFLLHNLEIMMCPDG
jgi:hypothetical protein